MKIHIVAEMHGISPPGMGCFKPWYGVFQALVWGVSSLGDVSAVIVSKIIHALIVDSFFV